MKRIEAFAGRRRLPILLIGLLAIIGLIGITALPGYSATGKIYWLSVSPSQATKGAPTDFFVTMMNKTPGPSNVGSFSVTLPTGFSLNGTPTISASSNANPLATITVSGSTVKVQNIAPVKNNQYVTLQINATPTGTCPSNPSNPPTWTAVVYAGNSLNGDTFALNNAGTAQQTSVVCGPNLSVTKQAHSTPVSVGDFIQFDIVVSNASGAGTATNVGVSDTLPAGLTWSIASQTASACSIGSGALTCTIPTMAGGSSYSVSVKATSASAGTVTNNGVTVTLNNQTVASAGPASVDVLAPGLNVTKTALVSNDGGTTWAQSGTATAGDLIGFDIVVSNSGSGTAKNVVASDTLPTDAGTSWTIASQTASACSISSGTLTCSIGNMTSGASYSARITSPTTAATVADSPVANTVSLTADNTSADPASASIAVWQGQLGCPSIADQGFQFQATTSGGGPSIGQLARLENLDNSPCVAKPFNFDSLLDQNTSLISFTQGSVAGQEQAQFVMQINWDPAVPTTATQTYTTTVAGKTTMIQYSPTDQEHAIQWCVSVQYDSQGNVVTAERPLRVDPGHTSELENWCLVSQNAVQQSDGKVAVTEVLYGFGDPNLRR